MKSFFSWIFNLIIYVIKHMMFFGVMGIVFILIIGVLCAVGFIGDDDMAVKSEEASLPTRPTQNIYVTDLAGMISDEDRKIILDIGSELDRKHKAQLAVVTIESLHGENINHYANKLFREWGIGDKKLNNGVLFLISKNDRKFRIEVGYGLEGALPDSTCSEMLKQLVPYFKVGDYSPAISSVYFQMAQKVYVEYGDEIPFERLDLPPPSYSRGEEVEAQHKSEMKQENGNVDDDDTIPAIEWKILLIVMLFLIVTVFLMYKLPIDWGSGGSSGSGGSGSGSSGGGFGGGSSEPVTKEATATGTGVIITTDGYIATNAHVIYDTEYNAGPAKSISVLLDNDTSYDAEVIGCDPECDLAVLKINEKNLSAAEFGDSDKLKLGESVIAIGNPLGFELMDTVTSGIVSGLDRQVTINDESMKLLQTDAAINSGNSGGPLINKYGQVIGINSSKMSASYAQTSIEGIGFAIPSNDVARIIDDFMEYGYVTGKPQLGISCQDVTDTIAKMYNLPVGVYVTDVTKDSAAEKAGLTKGDIITEFEGKEIKTYDELNAEKNKHEAGDEIELTFIRNGEEQKVKIVLDEANNKVEVDFDEEESAEE